MFSIDRSNAGAYCAAEAQHSSHATGCGGIKGQSAIHFTASHACNASHALHTFGAPGAASSLGEILGQDYGAQRIAHSHQRGCQILTPQRPDREMDVVGERRAVRLRDAG